MIRKYSKNLPKVESNFEYDPETKTYKIIKAGTYSINDKIVEVKEEDLE